MAYKGLSSLMIMITILTLSLVVPTNVWAVTTPTFLFKFGSTGTGDDQFNTPAGVAVDSSNRIIVSDFFNDRIQVFGLTNPTPVGGEILPIDMTSLFVAGISTNAFWMVPTLGGIAGAAIALFKIKRKYR